MSEVLCGAMKKNAALNISADKTVFNCNVHVKFSVLCAHYELSYMDQNHSLELVIPVSGSVN